MSNPPLILPRRRGRREAAKCLRILAQARGGRNENGTVSYGIIRRKQVVLQANLRGSMSDAFTAGWSLDAEGSAGEDKAVPWVVVSTTLGLMPATIIAGRLESEGIPARAWQEAAGQALGLTVGLLGTGHVSVPEPLVEQALALLEADQAAWAEEDAAWDEEE